MANFIFKRLFYGILVFFGVLTVVFFLFTILPGDPARMMAGQQVDEATLRAIRSEMGLDKPVLAQYGHYVTDLLPVGIVDANDCAENEKITEQKPSKIFRLLHLGHSCLVLKIPSLRTSWQSRREVTSILADALPKTLILAFVSIIFAMFCGVALGAVVAAVDKEWLNRAVLVVTVFGMSLPSFFAAVLIAWIFAFLLADYTGLSMFGSLYSVDHYGLGSQLELKNIILPAFTLGIRPLAIVTELTRSSVREVLAHDFVRTAKAKGLKNRQIIWRHALRNALNPVVTAVSGWFASLLAGAVFVEYVFDWKGIGVVIVDALEKFDLPVLMGAVLIIAVMLIIINTFVDIVYGILDPKIRIRT